MEAIHVASVFRISGTPVSCVSYGHGHINQTYKVVTDINKEYILQRINKYVFKDPVKLMVNASAVTNFIREKIADPRLSLHFIPTLQGQYYFRDDEGEFWRMCDYVGGFCLDAPEYENDFYQSALAFGRFQYLLSDFPADTLYETIPNFHNTIDRFRQLKESIKADNVGRLSGVQKEVEFALSKEEIGSTLQKMLEAGALPLRVTHNDTKLNNVLFDKDTRESLCVLDLDTVMPGLSAHDFGDSIRFGAATAAEDEPDYTKMKLDLHLFEVYTRGFLEAAPNLTETEVKVLPMGALIMTLEVGIRFLKDYLDGDLYFKIQYPDHNLVRARTQLALVADMLSKWEDMQRIVKEVSAEFRT